MRKTISQMESWQKRHFDSLMDAIGDDVYLNESEQSAIEWLSFQDEQTMEIFSSIFRKVKGLQE